MAAAEIEGQSLLEVVQREVEVVARLQQVLQSEFDILSRRDVDNIEQALEQKQALIVELGDLSEKRCNLLKNKGYSEDKPGHEAFLDDVGGVTGEALRRSWNELQENLESCKKQNQINGQVLEASRRSAEQALAILLGRGEQEPSLYNDKGSTEPSIGGNSSIKV